VAVAKNDLATRRLPHHRVVRILRAASALIAFAVAISAAHAGLDRSIEKMLGKQARDAVESQYVVVAQGPAADYVTRVGRSLVAVSPRHDVEYTFRLLDTEQVNAFALPWGYVYVTTGMLRFVGSSDELAGVIGHEIAHVAQKHSLSAFKKQFWATLLFGAVDAPAALLTVGQVGATLYLLRHSRKDEQAADKLGASYAYLGGYDASQLSVFLRKLAQEQKREPGKIEVYLSTHPTEQRREELLAELPEVSRKNAQVLARTARGFLDRHLASQAVIAYRRALELAPGDAGLHGGLARAYAELGAFDLARSELARAMESGLRDTAAIGESLAAEASPVSEVLLPSTEAEQRAIKDRISAAATWNAEVQDAARQLEDRSKSLNDKVRGLARRMSYAGAFGTPTFGTERVMEKAQVALYLIAETSDEIGAVAKGLKSMPSGAAEVLESLQRGLARPASAADQVQRETLAGEIASGISRASEQSPQVTQQALDAAKRADEAAGQLASAVNALASEFDTFGGVRSGLPFLGLAEGDVDRAIRTAREGLDASRRATTTLRAWRADELSWQLSAAYLDTPSAQRPALRSLAAAMLGLAPEALAQDQELAFGAAVMQAMIPKAAPAEQKMASKQPPAAATPSPGQPAASPAPPKDSASKPGAGAPQAASGEDLMLQLLLADVKREAEARAKWQGAAPPARGD
jgi:Zn-dependent protease with chaperone function